jgi:hypothetical protein
VVVVMVVVVLVVGFDVHEQSDIP